MVVCSVKGCSNRSDRGNASKVSFFSLPRVYNGPDEQLNRLTADRRALWLHRIDRGDLCDTARVCSEHFIAGKPASVHDTSSIDWAPSVKLGSLGLGSDEHMRVEKANGSPPAKKWSPLTSSCRCHLGAAPPRFTCDVATQWDVRDVKPMRSITTQCFIQQPTTAETQTDLPTDELSELPKLPNKVMTFAETGVNCRILRPPTVRPPDVLSSPSTQGTQPASQGSEYQPSNSEEVEYRQERLPEPEMDHKTTKFLVYKQCLVELLDRCPECGLSCSVEWQVKGTFVAVARRCSYCQFSHKWYSQPMANDIPAGNLNISAAIYFSGASFTKVNRIFSSLQMAFISSSTFYRHIRELVQPTILSIWTDHRKELLESLQKQPGEIILGGDMRADSPGYCAKFGSYTMMELSANRVIDISLIQVNPFVTTDGFSYHIR